jgi:uncharacterized protein (TIGR03790 family)
MRLLILTLLLGIGLAFRLEAASPAENAASTIVIYNLFDHEAKELADFYCAARSINTSQEIALIAPATEEISRSEYDASIAVPLRQEMVLRGYWIVAKDAQNHPFVRASRIHYAVLIRGMPLKIKQCQDYPGDSKVQPAPYGTCNAASVDSELSILGLFTPQISGVIKNPLYATNSSGGANGGEAALARIPPQMLLVSRLDAPTADAVKAMILNGIKAEKEGLWGWGYIDLRSTTDPGYQVGDQWIKTAGEAMRRNGIPVLSDDLPDTFQSGFPITDAAAYFGWYSENIDGPFRDAAFHFLPGAIAAHLHSFSATTLHDPLTGWTGPLIQRRASASVGNVYEPYLVFTTDFGRFEEKLLLGANLSESFYAAQPVLSWMSVLVGDPLYRPYAKLHDPESKTSSVWTDYQRIVLAHHGDVLMAAADLGTRAQETHESLYLEALGAAQEDAGYFPSARASFRDAALLTKDPNIRFRLILEQARALEKRGKSERGASLLRDYLGQPMSDAQHGLILDWIQRLDPIQPVPQATPSASQ